MKRHALADLARTVVRSRVLRQATELQAQYVVKACGQGMWSRRNLAKANTEVEAQGSITRGRCYALNRTTVASPVRGIVKDIGSLVGGGIPQPE